MLEKIAEFLKVISSKITTFTLKVIFKFALVHVCVLLLYFIVAVKFGEKIDVTPCYEENSFVTKTTTAKANPKIPRLDKSYRHEEFSHILEENEKNIGDYVFKLNNMPLKIKIVGQWSPWFDDLNEENKNFVITSDVKKTFYCSFERYNLPNDRKLSFIEEKEAENVFYYMTNYYKGITFRENPESKKIIAYGIEELPERQEQCWITRGLGLYLGVSGLSGKNNPTEFHQILGDTMHCQKNRWFNGKDFEDEDYIIEEHQYKYSDFIKNYFSLEYFLERDGKAIDNENALLAKDIFTMSSNDIVYNITLHENLLYKNKVNNVGLIIANAMNKFSTACYIEKKNSRGELERTSNLSYFIFGPKKLKKHYEGRVEDYNYGEVARFFILDKYYLDNIGEYGIEVLSGIELDDSGSIEKKIQEFEFALLGTSHPGIDIDRTDGLIAKIFHNILTSGFATLMRASLVLFVAVYGIRIFMGFGDKKMLSLKELMPYALRLGLIVALTTDTGFQFFNKTFINFIVNGTIGLIDLISGIFYTSLYSSDNMFVNTGNLLGTPSVLSLSRNFAVLDEILQLFRSEAILAKVFSLYFTQNFFMTAFGIPLFVYILYKYTITLVKMVIPFLMILLQWAMTLPLAPVMLLFSFFKTTNDYFKNWLKFCISKGLELFAFFTVFYFWTGIINNEIRSLLYFEVCVKRLSKFIVESIMTAQGIVGIAVAATVTFSVIMLIIKKIGVNWKAILSAVAIIGLIISALVITNFMPYFKITENTYSYYNTIVGKYLGTAFVRDQIIVIIMIILFDKTSKEIMSIISSIFTVDDAKADKGPMSDFEKFDANKQFKDFNSATGLSTMQKDTDSLKWTRQFLDLNKGITDNVVGMGKTLTDPLTKTAEGQIDALGSAISGTKDENGRTKSLKELSKEKLDESNKELKKEFFGKDTLLSNIASVDDNGNWDSAAFGSITDTQGFNLKSNEKGTFGQAEIGKKELNLVQEMFKASKGNINDSLISNDKIDELSGKNRELARELNKAFLEMSKNKTEKIDNGLFNFSNNKIDKNDLKLFNEELRRSGFDLRRDLNAEDLLKISNYPVESVENIANLEASSNESLELLSQDATKLSDADTTTLTDADATKLSDANAKDIIDNKVSDNSDEVVESKLEKQKRESREKAELEKRENRSKQDGENEG